MLEHFIFILEGVPLSLGLTVAALFLGFILALLLTGILTLWENRWQAKIARGFIIFFTGTPLLVQIFLFYTGPGQFAFIRESFLWPLFSEAWFCAILALSLNSAAYTAQLFYGAVKNISKNQWEACLALGMSRFEAMKILIPLALRRALPSYSNEIVLIFKSTSLVQGITLLDIMGRARELTGQTYDSITYYAMAGVIYLAVNIVLIAIAKLMERRALAFEN
ncbi:arginine ABC transporter permease ArtM [Ignatzschineria cameli]|uniref:arginine ABC transporter permease ArtM n=1 Tax=Ignatzschineria cameli TaxID=2182793 RepID=UPI000D61F3DA|nr:arginine ABC transporter permease ArtM [Ignatzschineria cameli]PWD85660.1 arginine ABC transporter permease ArtM [Ignatzschineria cameli]